MAAGRCLSGLLGVTMCHVAIEACRSAPLHAHYMLCSAYIWMTESCDIRPSRCAWEGWVDFCLKVYVAIFVCVFSVTETICPVVGVCLKNKGEKSCGIGIVGKSFVVQGATSISTPVLIRTFRVNHENKQTSRF